VSATGLTAVLCPQPPLLFRELGGAADPVAALRAACLTTLREALADGPDVVVVAGAVDGPVDPGGRPDVRRWGTTGERTGPGLPLSLGVGRRLLDDAGWTGPTELVGLDVDADDADLRALAAALAARPGRVLLLLLGEGSARRDPKGPGTLDERAFPFDDGLLAALRDGDAHALAALDPTLARDLMVLGRASLRLLGEVGLHTDGPPAADVAYADDPFGVMYVVATWRW
jgi:hypothetical protein